MVSLKADLAPPPPALRLPLASSDRLSDFTELLEFYRPTPIRSSWLILLYLFGLLDASGDLLIPDAASPSNAPMLESGFCELAAISAWAEMGDMALAPLTWNDDW